jgi:hypothetical protein
MKFAFVLLLAALFGFALAEDKQLPLHWDCSFHVNVTFRGQFGWHDMHGMMADTVLAYLREDVYASTNYTRILRYDLKRGSYMPYSINYSGGTCADGYTTDWSDFDSLVFRKAFVYYYDPERIACPADIPEVATQSCTKYCTYYSNPCIIVDDQHRIVEWTNKNMLFHWKNGTLPESAFELHYCDQTNIRGANITAPLLCNPEAGSIATVAKLVLAVALLVALL